MPEPKKPLNLMWLIGGATLLCIALVGGKFYWPQAESATELPATFPGLLGGTESAPTRTLHPLVELLKLVVAASMAMVVTFLNRRFHGDRPLGKSLEQAQILLCVSGAMMMIIIANSIARALGIAGAASIIRFRTPVEDPKDSVILLLLLALGMACGLGMFTVAGLGTFFLCLFLMVLDRIGETMPRPMMLGLRSDLPEFPSEHVHKVLGGHKLIHGAREVSKGAMKYFVMVPAHKSIEELSVQLTDGGASGIKSVEWEAAKKGKRAED